MRRFLSSWVLVACFAACGCDSDGSRRPVDDGGVRDAGGGAGGSGGMGTGGVPPFDAGSGGVEPADASNDAAPDASNDAAPDAPSDGGFHDGSDGGPGFGPFPGLDPGGVGRRIGAEFSVTPMGLQTRADGTSWLLWTSNASPDLNPRTPHLDRFDADGRYVGRSPLGDREPSGFVLHGSGALTAWRPFCGDAGETCVERDDDGAISETVWAPSPLTVKGWQLDWNGDVTGTTESDVKRRFVQSGAATLRGDDGLYVMTNEGATWVHELDASGKPVWSVEVLPVVLAPLLTIPPAPEDILRAARLTFQTSAKVVALDDGAIVAATVTRGTLAALNEILGAAFPLPDDPFCGDVLVVRVPAGGHDLRYWSVPTPECESLPELAIVGGHAVVSSWVPVPIPPVPNDTNQYDIGLAVVDLATGDAVHTTIGMNEDDIVQALAPCGNGLVCLAGNTGSRSVDTGSTLTYADGFVLPVSLEGAVKERWTLHSERHTTIPLLQPRSDGSVVFFATVDGPITHTGDSDPSLRFDRGLLGRVTEVAR